MTAPAITQTRLTHYSAEPLTALFGHDRVYAQPGAGGGFKPQGFWVSVDEDGEGWADWCRSEEFGLERLAHKHDVTLTPGARILWLTSSADLDDFTARYSWAPGWAGEYIDWRRVAADWQGIVITPYQWSRRLELFWYYGWDCASGCIWDLSAIESVNPDAQEGT